METSKTSKKLQLLSSLLLLPLLFISLNAFSYQTSITGSIDQETCMSCGVCIDGAFIVVSDTGKAQFLISQTVKSPTKIITSQMEEDLLDDAIEVCPVGAISKK